MYFLLPSYLFIVMSSIFLTLSTGVFAIEKAPNSFLNDATIQDGSPLKNRDFKADRSSGFFDLWSYFSDESSLERLHNHSFYHLIAYSDLGDVIQLQDDSKWVIESSGRSKVLQWVQADDIFIKPCTYWFSSYNYVLHNRTTHEVVQANIVIPPVPLGPYTFWIIDINHYQHRVMLSDYSVWELDLEEGETRLRIGDRVFLGVNNYWRTATYPQILINADTQRKTYMPAIFKGYSL